MHTYNLTISWLISSVLCCNCSFEDCCYTAVAAARRNKSNTLHNNTCDYLFKIKINTNSNAGKLKSVEKTEKYLENWKVFRKLKSVQKTEKCSENRKVFRKLRISRLVVSELVVRYSWHRCSPSPTNSSLPQYGGKCTLLIPLINKNCMNCDGTNIWL